MASVRERAAALDLAGKLYSPMHRPGDHRMVSKPFQCSIIWSNIIAHLQAEVKVKRRRHYLKSHSNCFLGSDAVSVIEAYINQNKILGDINATRAKVVRVCQALLDCKVFEAVACKAFGKENKLSVFQDSDSSLYRFLGAKNSPLRSGENSLPSSTVQSQTHSQQLYSTPVKADHIMDLLLEEPDLSPSFLQTETLPQSVISQVWQEQTVQRLLQLIELPLLDGVLDCRECNTPLPGAENNTVDLLYTSNYLDREILKAFKDSQKDEWISAALDLLEFLPDQLVVEVSRELPSFSLENDEGDEGHGPSTSLGVEQCKTLLFDILAKHYGQATVQPLLTSALNDVCTQITELLVNGKFEVALEVLQLCLKLLPMDNREELYRLLRFMSLAAEPEHVRLHKETENRMMVKKTFSRAIIQSKCLPKGKVDLLLLFMLDNYQEIFKIPGSLHKLVSDKLDDLLKKNPNTHSYAFCQQMSRSLYENTVKELTKSELFVLLRNIDENEKYSTKEKNRLLSQFNKGHPDVFAQYFGSRLSTINLFEV
ncbi:DEP domain-containing protein 7 isoform X2 [Pygocentrus nattereri]|uniref:DEP domain-containing protein 7 isoform X2 n=1 Tax=Pygocentrus nattereri TaxID=42514 RepID=UPI00081476F9|nr:DEP domain-containing protein 7 isoform X2 [Pygocentrus nattereri]